KGVDVDGLLTSAIGFGLIVFALIEGTNLGWWQPKGEFSLFGWTWDWPISVVPIAAVVGISFIVLFVLWERHRERVKRDALLDLALFKVPTFTLGNIAACMIAVGEFALVFSLPLYLINVAGLGTLQAGYVLGAMAVGALVSGASARKLAEKFGASGVVLLGLVLEIVGVVAVAFVVADQGNIWLLAALLVVYGIGLGLAAAQLTSTVLADIPKDLSGAGSATQSTVRQLGAAIGAAISATALATGIDRVLAERLAAIDGVPAPMAQRLAEITAVSAGSNIPGLRGQGDSSRLGGLTDQVVQVMSQAFAEATQQALFLSAAAITLGLVAAILVRRADLRKPTAGATEAHRHTK
ncbi:MAG: MFS transporter, partial [Propionibacteriales bacterium]